MPSALDFSRHGHTWDALNAGIIAADIKDQDLESRDISGHDGAGIRAVTCHREAKSSTGHQYDGKGRRGAVQNNA